MKYHFSPTLAAEFSLCDSLRAAEEHFIPAATRYISHRQTRANRMRIRNASLISVRGNCANIWVSLPAISARCTCNEIRAYLFSTQEDMMFTPIGSQILAFCCGVVIMWRLYNICHSTQSTQMQQITSY